MGPNHEQLRERWLYQCCFTGLNILWTFALDFIAWHGVWRWAWDCGKAIIGCSYLLSRGSIIPTWEEVCNRSLFRFDVLLKSEFSPFLWGHGHRDKVLPHHLHYPRSFFARSSFPGFSLEVENGVPSDHNVAKSLCNTTVLSRESDWLHRLNIINPLRRVTTSRYVPPSPRQHLSW